jgi:hypothetical protein
LSIREYPLFREGHSAVSKARDYLIIPFEKVELKEAMLGVKQRKQDRLRMVERRVSRLSMKKQLQFWATSNL